MNLTAGYVLRNMTTGAVYDLRDTAGMIGALLFDTWEQADTFLMRGVASRLRFSSGVPISPEFIDIVPLDAENRARYLDGVGQSDVTFVVHRGRKANS